VRNREWSEIFILLLLFLYGVRAIERCSQQSERYGKNGVIVFPNSFATWAELHCTSIGVFLVAWFVRLVSLAFYGEWIVVRWMGGCMKEFSRLPFH